MHGAVPAPQPSTTVPPEGDVVRVLREDGSLDPAGDPKIEANEVVAIYRAMVRVRALDERLVGLQRLGRIAFHVGSQGEEGAILGSAAALRARDWIFPCYREFGAALSRGMPLAAYVNHMFGNAEDPIKGRQMPDHYGAKVARFASISSPVGTQITHAAGFAWAAKIKKDDVATLVYFGEGAASSGEFHHGLNFAGVFRVPLVLFCRNNSWSAPCSAGAAVAQSAPFATKGVAYGVPAVRCDGNDLFAVLKVTGDAVARALRGDGPTLIEALTTRMPVSSASERGARDGARDSSDRVWAEWRKRDPLARVRHHLVSRGLWSETLQLDYEAETASEIEAAIDAAEKLGPPALPTMFDDVFCALTPQLEEERVELLAGPRAPRTYALAKP